nr:unnamed protein product [Callosobruchus analis]
MCVERTKKWLQCIVLVLSVEQSVSGIANYEGDEGFNHDLNKMYQDMSNTGRYGEHRGIVKNSLDQNQFNSGFRNTYHKDETGSNSSFFDDGGDEGDEYVRKAQHGQYGDSLQENHRGSNLASKNYANNAAEQSSYDKGHHGSQAQGRNGNFGRNQYYDDKEHANAANAAKAYGEAGRYVQQAPFRQYDNYGDQGDYVELDVRPPLHPAVSGRQRYDQRGPPHYDDYY